MTENKVDFVWSSNKDYSCILPLFQYMKKIGWNVNIYKIHRHLFRNRSIVRKLASHAIAAYDVPMKRLQKMRWDGRFIYVDHGVGPIKYYAYRYKQFFDCELLFYQGEVFKRKMELLNPNFKNGLLGGFTKMDELVTIKIDRELMCAKYRLNPDKPIILFAPTWGGKYSNHWGIKNAKYLTNFPNLIIAPHSGDYKYAKRFNAVIPEKISNINMFIKLCDVVVSDISSIIGEAAAIGKSIVQIILPSYPGCFPNFEKRKEGTWIPDDVIFDEENKTDREKRPFKIAYLDEDWIVGQTAKPENLREAVQEVIENPEKFKGVFENILKDKVKSLF